MINNHEKSINKNSFSMAFTIVELIVVVVVIGILAAISIVVYSGARDKAIKTSITTQLVGSASELKSFRFSHNKFPSTIDCTTDNSSTNYCLEPGDDVSYTYRVDDDSDPQSFTLYATSLINGKIYSITTDGTVVSEVSAIPVKPTGWKQISGGLYHTCASSIKNKAYCWGYNYYGQIGNNTTIDSHIPTLVDTTGVLSDKSNQTIGAGYKATCSIASDSQAYCWGYNTNGQLGNNSTANSSVPVAVYTAGVLSGKTIKVLGSSFDHTCVIASDDQAYCWGYGNSGVLGNNSTANSSVPVAVYTAGVLSGKTVKAISIGYFHTCAIASDSQVYCWGYNAYGQLGNNSTTTTSYVPVAVYTSGVFSGKTIKTIDSGYYHTCAIASDNQAYCWGRNNSGQLGNNSTTNSIVPIAVDTSGVLNGKTIIDISSGGANHTCAIASDNQAYCWGLNNYGQLGNNSTTSSLIPVAVDTSGLLSGKELISINAGANHTCAIASDNQAYCWGYNNDGQLGNDSTTNSSVPVQVIYPES